VRHLQGSFTGGTRASAQRRWKLPPPWKLCDDGAKLCDDGAKLCDDGAKLCDDGAKLDELEGVTRMRDGDGLGRGALVHVGELGRGALVQLDEEDGAVRRRLSPVKALRALDGTRGEACRSRASDDGVKRWRPKSALVMRVPERRVAFGDGSVRTAGID